MWKCRGRSVVVKWISDDVVINILRNDLKVVLKVKRLCLCF